VGIDLFRIAFGDSELGTADRPVEINGVKFQKVTYTPGSGQSLTVGQQLILDLVGQPRNVLVFGVDSSTTQSLGGVDGLGQVPIPPDADGTIRLFYDTTECGGRGAFVVDKDNQPILDPPHVILYHEMVHVKHLVNNTFNADQDAEERQTRIEENVYRQVMGLPLRSEANASGGCRTPSTPKPFGSDDTAKGFCFIVTATSGSSRSPEVQALQRFRDRFLRRTQLGRIFFRELFREYYKFSPAISRDLAKSPRLRSGMAAVVVGPFLDFIRLLEAHLTQGPSSNSFLVLVRALFSQQLRQLADAGLDGAGIEHVCERMAELEMGRDVDRESGLDGGAVPPCVTARNALDHLVAEVAARTSTTEYTRWGLWQPLRLQWSALDRARRGAGWGELVRCYAEAIPAWFGQIPLPGCLARFPVETMRDDLLSLRATFFREKEARRHFAGRLVDVFRERVPYDLESILREVGYELGSIRTVPSHAHENDSEPRALE